MPSHRGSCSVTMPNHSVRQDGVFNLASYCQSTGDSRSKIYTSGSCCDGLTLDRGRPLRSPSIMADAFRPEGGTPVTENARDSEADWYPSSDCRSDDDFLLVYMVVISVSTTRKELNKYYMQLIKLA